MNAVSFTVDIRDEIFWLAQVLEAKLHKCPYEILLLCRSEFTAQTHRLLIDTFSRLKTKSAVVLAIKRAVALGDTKLDSIRGKLRYAGILDFLTDCSQFTHAKCQPTFYRLFELCPSVQASVTQLMRKREDQRAGLYLLLLDALYRSLDGPKKKEFAVVIYESMAASLGKRKRDALQDALLKSKCCCTATDAARSYVSVKIRLNGKLMKPELRAIKAGSSFGGPKTQPGQWQPEIGGQGGSEARRGSVSSDEVQIVSREEAIGVASSKQSARLAATSLLDRSPRKQSSTGGSDDWTSLLQRSHSISSRATHASHDRIEVEDDASSVKSDSTVEFPAYLKHGMVRPAIPGSTGDDQEKSLRWSISGRMVDMKGVIPAVGKRELDELYDKATEVLKHYENLQTAHKRQGRASHLSGTDVGEEKAGEAKQDGSDGEDSEEDTDAEGVVNERKKEEEMPEQTKKEGEDDEEDDQDESDEDDEDGNAEEGDEKTDDKDESDEDDEDGNAEEGDEKTDRKKSRWGEKKDQLLIAMMKLRQNGESTYASALFDLLNRTEKECKERYELIQGGRNKTGSS